PVDPTISTTSLGARDLIAQPLTASTMAHPPRGGITSFSLMPPPPSTPAQRAWLPRPKQKRVDEGSTADVVLKRVGDARVWIN
ncbi:hypothetical protein GBA52_016625, partial [Prunus armeniaca]